MININKITEGVLQKLEMFFCLLLEPYYWNGRIVLIGYISFRLSYTQT